MNTLWNRSFILWLIASAQSRLGAALAGIALSFLVLNQTGSAGRMAQTLALSLLPALLMPLAGTLVDRISLKIPLIAAGLAQGVLQLTVGGLALAWGEVPLWLINAAALLGGLAAAFENPAANAALPALVPEAELTRANGLLGGLGQAMTLLGTLAGGFLAAKWSPAGAILIDGITFLLFSLLLLWVRLPRRPPGQAKSSVWADLKSGLTLMRLSPLLSMVPLLALLLNGGLAPVTAVLPKLMQTLGPGASGYGVYLALESGGMLLAGGFCAVMGQRLVLRRAMSVGFVFTALAYAGMWISPVFPVLLGCAVVLGLGFGLINVPVVSLIQQLVPATHLGRVFSVLNAVGALGMPLVLLAVSPLVDHLPLSLWFLISAATQGIGFLAWQWVLRFEVRNTGARAAEPG